MNDAQHFLLEHFETIVNSPSHIYSYALQFSPPSSWLHKYYRAQLSQGVRVVKGIPAEWGTCARTVFLSDSPHSLAYWKDTIVVGLRSGDITILDAITGSKMAVLSEHTGCVRSLAFSLDGTFFVSGGNDKNIKLWDVQTGGVVKTFCGHTNHVYSVSISPDCTTIASGSLDRTIRLWHIQAGDCFCVIKEFNHWINSVSFSPTNPQLLISASNGNTVQQWDTNGCQIGPTHKGKGVAFSSDGTHFVSWAGKVATVHNSGSRVVVAQLQVSGDTFQCCCFSPNGKLVIGSVESTIYAWNITGSDPYLVETFTGHTSCISSLIFAASPISASWDNTVKFWQIGALSTDSAAADTLSTSLRPYPIVSVSLQARNGVAISFDSAGVVATWDILTGLHKAFFQAPVIGDTYRDAQLIESRLIAVWCVGSSLSIWDAEKNKFLQIVDIHVPAIKGIKISGDGSKVFCLIKKSIQAWAIQTGEAVGKVELEGDPYLDPFYVDGSKIWVCFVDSSIQGWDFGISGSSPILLSNTIQNRPHLNLIGGVRQETGPIMVETMDAATRKVFQLVGRYAQPTVVQWDGQYLVAGYRSGEILILDFSDALQ